MLHLNLSGLEGQESAEVVDCVTGFLTCRNPQGGTGGKWLAKVRVVVVGNMATKSEL